MVGDSASCNDRDTVIRDSMSVPLDRYSEANVRFRRPSGLVPLDGKFGGEFWPTYNWLQLLCRLVRQEAKFEGEGSRDRLGGKL